jgi:hypothetical protein
MSKRTVCVPPATKFRPRDVAQSSLQQAQATCGCAISVLVLPRGPLSPCTPHPPQPLTPPFMLYPLILPAGPGSHTLPANTDGGPEVVGKGPGEGMSVNVAWNTRDPALHTPSVTSMGDPEYLAAWQHVLLPIAREVQTGAGPCWQQARAPLLLCVYCREVAVGCELECLSWRAHPAPPPSPCRFMHFFPSLATPCTPTAWLRV